jgi:hypothetical protein
VTKNLGGTQEDYDMKSKGTLQKKLACYQHRIFDSLMAEGIYSTNNGKFQVAHGYSVLADIA